MKQRIDQLLVMRGHFESRERAKRSLMAGIVFVNGQRIDKAGMLVDSEAQIEVRGEKLKYVSRGGLKLEKAIKEFDISLSGKVCMDIGASTGGFTDCMLQNGAIKVYAVDTGYGQLDYSLRQNENVICLEKTNARYLDEVFIADEIDFISVDVSFISIKTIMPAVITKLKNSGEMVCLIKPQFEAGREKVGKGGVVRDLSVHIDVISDIVLNLSKLNLIPKSLSYSPITGPNGNIEFLLYLVYNGRVSDDNVQMSEDAEQIDKIQLEYKTKINDVVMSAHEVLAL